MFIVSSNAMGIARGGVQTVYGTEYSVRAYKKEVAAYIDWYHVAANKYDWGRFGVKLGLAYAAYIEGRVVKAMASSITSDGSSISDIAKNQCISGYIVNGFNDDSFVTLARNVELANGGSQVYALGTKIALSKILPKESANSGFRYGENSSIIKTGYLPSYKGVPMIELGNALVPNTINGKPEVIVSDKVIYMIPMGQFKPVKVVFEGNTLTVTKNPLEQADHTYNMIVNLMVGADVIVGKIVFLTIKPLLLSNQ